MQHARADTARRSDRPLCACQGVSISDRDCLKLTMAATVPCAVMLYQLRQVAVAATSRLRHARFSPPNRTQHANATTGSRHPTHLRLVPPTCRLHLEGEQCMHAIASPIQHRRKNPHSHLHRHRAELELADAFAPSRFTSSHRWALCCTSSAQVTPMSSTPSSTVDQLCCGIKAAPLRSATEATVSTTGSFTVACLLRPFPGTADYSASIACALAS
jgi:hypothetical protein